MGPGEWDARSATRRVTLGRHLRCGRWRWVAERARRVTPVVRDGIAAGLLGGCVGPGRVFATAAAVRPGSPSGPDHRIVVHADQVAGPFDRRLLGTNVPAWLSPRARGRATSSASSPWRRAPRCCGCPGGSWSNSYDWLGCELGDPQRCQWTWAMRPSDFVGLLEATGLPGDVDGLDQRHGARKRPRAVAFFNGDVDDDRPIGTDRNGRDWQTVGHWAQLRAEHGHPEPVPIRYWEVGNEVYGAVKLGGAELCVVWAGRTSGRATAPSTSRATTTHDGFLAVPRGDAGGRSRHRGRRGRCRRPGRLERLGRQGDGRAPATTSTSTSCTTTARTATSRRQRVRPSQPAVAEHHR